MTTRFFFTLGFQIQAIVLGWQMYALTHDALHLGLVGLAEAVPALSLAMYAGHLVDRSRPLMVYRGLLMVSLISGLILLFFHQTPIGLFAASFLTGTARSFAQPAMFAIVPRIVPRESLARASAWMTSALQIARISGPAVGGILYGWVGVTGSSAVVCLSILIALIQLFRVRTVITPKGAPAEAAHKPVLPRHEFWLGARFVKEHPILLPALTMDMISVFFGGVTALLPIYAAEILLIGAKGLGALRAAPALGAVIMSYCLTRLDIRPKAGRWLYLGAGGFGVSILVFSISHNYMLSLIALALSGALDSISMVVRTSAVQMYSPDHMRGRISAVNSMFIGSSNELGEFESGVAARLLGTINSAIFGSLVCIATVVTVMTLSPRLRRLSLEDQK